MPKFTYRFINPVTGRPKRAQQRAFDVNELSRDLMTKGIEPFDISQVADEPATEPQIQLMRERGIAAPVDATKADASALITNFFERVTTAEAVNFQIAAALRVEVNRFASKNAIYSAILFDLQRRADMPTLGSWFAYRVYRNGFDRRAPGLRDPTDERFQSIGRRIADDPKLLASLRRAASTSRVNWRYFGELVAPDGVVLQGDGMGTGVYRYTIGRLSEVGLLSGGAIEKKSFAFRDEVSSRVVSGAKLPSGKTKDLPSGCSSVFGAIGVATVLGGLWLMLR